MIRDVLKTATKAAITWVGSKFGPEGAAIGEKVGEKVSGALFNKSDLGGGDFQIIDTSLKQMPRFAGRLPFQASRMAGGARGYAETVNPETLYASWDRRLGKYYSDKYKVARTVKGKVV